MAKHKTFETVFDGLTKDLALSFTDSLIQSPLNSLAQCIDVSFGTKLLPSVQLVEAPQRAELGSASWFSQSAGHIAGALPYYLLCATGAKRVIGLASNTRLLQPFLKPSPMSRAIAESALIGFGLDSTLKPLDSETLNKHGLLWGHTLNGISGAGTFALQTGLAMKADKPLTQLLGSKNLAHVASGASTGALSGFAGTELNSYLLQGKLDHKAASNAAMDMLLLGSITSALHKPTSRFEEAPKGNFVGRDSEIMHSDGTTSAVGKDGAFLKPSDLLTKSGPIIGEFRLPSHTKLLETTAQTLKAHALQDHLTGLPNRRLGELAMERAFQQARRTYYESVQKGQPVETPLSILFMDLDNFGKVNKLISDACGDSVLQEMAAKIKQEIRRPSDILYRKGGDEFVAILPGTNAAEALEVARRIQDNAHTVVSKIENNNEVSVQVSTSTGTVTYLPSESQFSSTADIMTYADGLMRLDKAQRKSKKADIPLSVYISDNNAIKHIAMPEALNSYKIFSDKTTFKKAPENYDSSI